MFIVYHSNNLDVHKDILLDRMDTEPLSDPLQTEIILVQSPGMAQWLQLCIADAKGVAANLQFPMPASFIWQQYIDNFPDVIKQNQFHKEAMTWHLMGLIKQECLHSYFSGFKDSFYSDQYKLYQLASKIADLFDQYLVYRPDWIIAWEDNNDIYIEQQIKKQFKQKEEDLFNQIKRDIVWQGILWRALVKSIGEDKFQHRAHLHSQYLKKLKQERPKNLPTRLFIFGISSLPKVYLETFSAISKYCDVHLFFNNPSQYYWGDIVNPSYLQKLKLTQRTLYQSSQQQSSLFSIEQLHNLAQNQFELTQEAEILQIGNPLLAAWGKLGRDFFYLLNQIDTLDIQANVTQSERTLLAQIQNRILALVPNGKIPLRPVKNDYSISIHSCHSAMREVEVLHDYLLRLFQENDNLTPKDIVVMVANIDKYAPYIQAVFNQYQDNRYIPFSISDSKLSDTDVLLAAFLSLLKLKNCRFSAEDVLAFLDIPAIRAKFAIELQELDYIRYWVATSGIRFGLDKYPPNQSNNYNAWKAGLERMLLGYAMREENGVWQDSLGLDSSHGLKGQLAGLLAEFIELLYGYQQILQQEHHIAQWQQYLTQLVDDFFIVDEQTSNTLGYIKATIQQLTEQLQEIAFEQLISSEVIADVMTEKLDSNDKSMRFLVGKVNFCTLLPMRSIPFPVVCLLGMNETDYPRHQVPNSFDLMQYHRQKGDRSRRDDDRYLFLEALLAAQEYLYISYIGRSITDNQVREPSVLVHQLLDYLTENIDDQNQSISLVQQHPMKVFSPENFTEKYRSFAKEWLPLAQCSKPIVNDFIQPILSIEQETCLELSQLIQFIQNPVRFFFEKHLGVYYRAEDKLISDSENFTLDNLELYQINHQLLAYTENEIGDFFTRLKIKGILPRGAFGQIYESKILSEIMEFKQIVNEYQQQFYDSERIELLVQTNQGEILLYGYLDKLFGPQKQRVTWRAGKNKDSYIIENWIYYLVQCITNSGTLPPVFYAKGDKSGVDKYTFNILDKSAALNQLTIYLESYLQSNRLLQLVPTQDIMQYLDLIKEDEKSGGNKCLERLNKIANGDSYTKSDVYWQRVMEQTEKIDMIKINTITQAWFKQMIGNLVKNQ